MFDEASFDNVGIPPHREIYIKSENKLTMLKKVLGLIESVAAYVLDQVEKDWPHNG